MIYLQKHSDNKNKKNITTKISVGILLVLFFYFSQSILSLTSSLFKPFFVVGSKFYSFVEYVPNIISSKHSLVLENEELQRQIESFGFTTIDRDALFAENILLKQQLQLNKDGEQISALVISRHPQFPIDTLLLNKGTDDGIVQGKHVLVGNKLVIGVISKVNKDTSVVTLNSFSQNVSQGFLSRTNEQIEVYGLGGSVMQSIVPIDFDIQDGDMIFQSGNSINVLGVVGLIEPNTSVGSKKILISLPANISKTNVVFVDK